MHYQIRELIYSIDFDIIKSNQAQLLDSISDIAKKAFLDKDESSLMTAHRILYEINMAHLANFWKSSPKNISHPLVAHIKYQLEQSWEKAEKKKYSDTLHALPNTSHFPVWVKQFVQAHHSNELHPIFTFLQNDANIEQMREFFFQESPLEMLFGDIVAFMLPGVYGPIKTEYLKNYWDEVGRGEDKYVHRNLRANLMQRIQIPPNCYIENSDLLIREELELINMYLSLATNRPKHLQLMGAMLTTELMISGRFVYQIKGWQRHGLNNAELSYLTEHVSADEIHAEDWLYHVVMPVLADNAAAMPEIILGVCRRLDTAAAVLDKLYNRIQKTEIASIGAFNPEAIAA